jgi:DNA-3-methyladenine glycosylase II
MSVEGDRHLGRDPRLAALIKRCGPRRLSPRRQYYQELCRAIISQQVSVRSAEAVFNRFCSLYPGHRPTPRQTLELAPELLCGVGLSCQKIDYITGLASHFSDRSIVPARLWRLGDEQVIDCLTQVKGIGRWTVEMFLIFVLARPDVFSAGDLGIRAACAQLAGRGALTEAEVLALAEAWRPWRSLACLYLWASLGDEPFWDQA